MFHTTAQTVQHVDAGKFRELIQSGEGVILDVRTPEEYSRSHIEGSTLINVADQDFVTKIALLPKDKPVYLYCLTGSRSAAAAGYMAKTGFAQLYNLQYGIMDWSRKGLPTVQSEAAATGGSMAYTEQSFRQLIQSEKVVLVDFHAPWCAPCKSMGPVIEKLAEDFQGRAKVEKVDVEANEAITKAYQVQSIPAFILFREGQKVWSHKGLISYDELSDLVNRNL